MSRVEADAQTLAAYIGLLKVMRDYDLKRVISFHGRVLRESCLISFLSESGVDMRKDLSKGENYTRS